MKSDDQEWLRKMESMEDAVARYGCHRLGMSSGICFSFLFSEICNAEVERAELDKVIPKAGKPAQAKGRL